MKHLALTLSLLIAFNLQAQKQKQDQQAIKKMCGCYKVGFNFAETFIYSKDDNYKPSKVKHDKALEWVELIKDKEDTIVMQHLLIVGEKDNPHIIKHWRQDWIYENTDFYMYNADNKWDFIQKPKADVKGQWTQKVFQVDDSPRYEGTATWVHIDGKSYWENITDAPLPRREETKRDDYNVTVRGNRHEITENGWIHDQDNDKVVRKKGKEDFILAQEKGYNTYVKVADEECKAAQDWWKENRAMWQLVRDNWDDIFARNKNLKLKKAVKNKQLYEYLFDLDPKTENKELNKIIYRFVR